MKEDGKFHSLINQIMNASVSNVVLLKDLVPASN